MMLTNRGSPPQVASFSVDSSGWPRNEAIIDILSCTEFATGAGGSVSVSYSKEGYGGLPYVFMLVSDARQLGVCSDDQMGILSAADLTAADAATRRAPLAIGTVLAAAAAALAALSFL
jgi:alpha-amylase